MTLHHISKRFFILFAILLTGIKLHAQTYPVQVAVTTIPPYQNYFSSYANEDRLKVTLTFTDFASPPVQVHLKLRFDSPTFDFESNPLSQPVFTLYPGVPYTLTTEELQTYFQNQFPVDGPQNGLTEGASSFCVEVRAVSNNEVLNNLSCGYFFLQYGQPAQQILPACNSTLTYSATDSEIPDPILFSFAPPIAPIGLQTEVVNKLYIYNYSEGITAQNLQQPLGLISITNPPIELPLGSNSYSLNAVENQLVKGNKYVWYIHSTLQGTVNQFQNDGWSAPCIFTYDEADSYSDNLINGLSIEWQDAEGSDPNPGFYPGGESKAHAKWKVVAEEGTQAISFSEYIFSYRKKVATGEEEFDWFHDTVQQLSTAIYQLEPATTYEAYVRGRLGSSETDPTEIREILTDSARTYACGVRDLPGRMTVFEPLTYADPGTRVKIGQFELEMVDVQPTGEPGYFAGTGLVAIDFLMGAEAKVRFNDLKIDKEYVVWDGTATVITQGLDAWLQDQYEQFQDPIWVDGTIDSAYVSDSLAHIVLNGVDTTFEFPCPTCPVIINDAAGNQVTIYPNGVVVWSTYLDISDEQLDVPDTEIALFEQNEDETGGFDPYQHTQWHENYEIIRTSNSVNYFVANKSTLEGQIDKIDVSVPKNKYEAEDVKLNWEGRTAPLDPVSSIENGDRLIFTFELPAFEEGEVSIYAISDGFKIGKVNVVRYEVIEKNVVIVPVAGNSINENDLTTYLNETFSEAGINLSVTISDTIGVGQYASTTFNVPDATLMTKYGPDMRAIRYTYFNERDLNDDTYYLFVVAGLQDTVNNQSVDGYMVRGKSIGFISTSADLHTIAHELGHGIGGLEHSWKNNGPAEQSTDNLMDYGSGTELILAQWEELRNPRGGSFWDEEEDNQSQHGMVAYYIWIESQETVSAVESGPIHTKIVNAEVWSPLVTNYEMRISSNEELEPDLTMEQIKETMYQKNADHGDLHKSPYFGRLDKKIVRNLESVIYYLDYERQEWKSIVRGPVMYFEVKILGDNKYRKEFLFASDYVTLPALSANINVKANSHYTVKKFVKNNGDFDHYEVFTYDGKNVTYQFTSSQKNPPKRYLVFSNGYRGPFQNIDESDGLVTTTDRYGYWTENGFSKKMIERLNAKGKTYYIDGSFRIWTSNHETFGGFAASAHNIETQYWDYKLGVDDNPYDSFSALNTTPNVDGFDYRKYQGHLAGKAFLAKIKADPRSVGVKDTVDIVAHSMGYAYAVGFVEEIKQEVHFGRFYIFAPENACSGGNDWSMFEEVWQYGANNNYEDGDKTNCLTLDGTRDPFFWQDGIAPQCAVKNIESLPNEVVGGRVYIPKTFSEKGFNASHYIKNYTWVFGLTNSDFGYVKKR